MTLFTSHAFTRDTKKTHFSRTVFTGVFTVIRLSLYGMWVLESMLCFSFILGQLPVQFAALCSLVTVRPAYSVRAILRRWWRYEDILVRQWGNTKCTFGRVCASVFLLPAEATAVLFSASSKRCQHDNSWTAALMFGTNMYLDKL